MANFKYVGTPAQFDVSGNASQDLVSQSYVNFLLSQNLTGAAVSNQIATLLAPYSLATTTADLMSGLATPAWIQNQMANYVAANTINKANGPIPLDPITLQVPKGQIAVPSGSQLQQFPSPFWSPASYNSGVVSATHTPVQLYTVAIADPTYPYYLVCSGSQDCQVAADNGTFPVITVRQGSPTSTNIVGIGYGVAESYTGATPGGQQAQATFSTASTTISGTSWNSVGTLTPTGTSGWYVPPGTTANYLGAPTLSSMPATITAVMNYTHALAGLFTLPLGEIGTYWGTVNTHGRIVDQQGNQYASGESSYTGTTPGGGTVSFSWTGTVTAGQQFALQGIESGVGNGVLGQGPGNYGYWTGGSITITPPQVAMQSTATIISTPFDNQTPITGPTTLYVMINSSDTTNATAVSASAFDPGLWVMPVPAS